MASKKIKEELLALQRWRVKCYCDADCTWRTLKHGKGDWIRWEDVEKLIKKV